MPILITTRARWNDLRIIAQFGRSLSKDRSRHWLSAGWQPRPVAGYLPIAHERAVWLHERLMRRLTLRFTLRLSPANEVLPLQYGLRSSSLPKPGLRGSQ